MGGIGFEKMLWRKQKEYMLSYQEPDSVIIGDGFVAFAPVLDYFRPGQTVAQIACGGILEDLFHTMERVGPEGRIILIEENPSFVYNRALQLLGEGCFPLGRRYYVENSDGQRFLKELFAEARVETYVQHLPPYPAEITDNSLDHVMAVNAAAELMGTRTGGPPPDVEGIVVETYRKLKLGGSFAVQGLVGGDIEQFAEFVQAAKEKHDLGFDEDFELQEMFEEDLMFTRYWGRWVKRA